MSCVMDKHLEKKGGKKAVTLHLYLTIKSFNYLLLTKCIRFENYGLNNWLYVYFYQFSGSFNRFLFNIYFTWITKDVLFSHEKWMKHFWKAKSEIFYQRYNTFSRIVSHNPKIKWNLSQDLFGRHSDSNIKGIFRNSWCPLVYQTKKSWSWFLVWNHQNLNFLHWLILRQSWVDKKMFNGNAQEKTIWKLNWR